MLKSNCKFRTGNVLVPINNEDIAFYLREVIVDEVRVEDFLYDVVDLDGDLWQVSPLILENEFVLKESASIGGAGI